MFICLYKHFEFAFLYKFKEEQNKGITSEISFFFVVFENVCGKFSDNLIKTVDRITAA